MEVDEFIKYVEKFLPCKCIYYPRDCQVIVFTNINNKNIKLRYNAEIIERSCKNEILNKVNDDLFRIANEINTGRL